MVRWLPWILVVLPLLASCTREDAIRPESVLREPRPLPTAYGDELGKPCEVDRSPSCGRNGEIAIVQAADVPANWSWDAQVDASGKRVDVAFERDRVTTSVECYGCRLPGVFFTAVMISAATDTQLSSLQATLHLPPKPVLRTVGELRTAFFAVPGVTRKRAKAE